MSEFLEYLGLNQITGVQALAYICVIAAACVGYVMWHARKRLKLTRKQLRETEWPNR